MCDKLWKKKSQSNIKRRHEKKNNQGVLAHTFYFKLEDKCWKYLQNTKSTLLVIYENNWIIKPKAIFIYKNRCIS